MCVVDIDLGCGFNLRFPGEKPPRGAEPGVACTISFWGLEAPRVDALICSKPQFDGAGSDGSSRSMRQSTNSSSGTVPQTQGKYPDPFAKKPAPSSSHMIRPPGVSSTRLARRVRWG